ncbi:unnamed protein product [Urochloa decumbens]|uniref:Peptidase A1 domain-containing protein n=1 Tax=Urochloa decumbens TaxID=240449 RepID=A0ABC9FU73_9POAL
MRRRSLPPRGRCCLAAVLALAAALASPRRLVASGAAADWHDVSVGSLLPGAVCTAAEEASNSSALRVVHRHGPCSPLQQSRRPPSHAAEILARDQERVNYIHRKIAGGDYSKSNKGSMSLPARWGWGTSLGINTYFVTVGLGTPARSLSVEFDTGSGMSWVQCEPCADCYEQQDPVFDPAKSSTFFAVPCSSNECQQFGSSQHNCSSSGNNSSSCPYEVIYGDDSQTDGDLARDTLTLTLAPSDDITVPGFVFGCGHRNTGVFGELDGLIGLDRYAASLPSQAAPSLGGAGFSYCLPSTSSAVGYLSFGGRRPAPANAQYTAMLTGKYRSFYYLDLVGVRVAGRPVRIPPAVFATAGGTMIDSGTAFTRLPPRAYAALRSAFARAMGRYKYKRALALPYLDTCYDLTGITMVRVPSVALVFAGGATVTLDHSGVLYTWDNASQVCLAFAPNDDDTSMGVVGSMQQKTLAVAYDVAKQKIGFGPKGCA